MLIAVVSKISKLGKLYGSIWSTLLLTIVLYAVAFLEVWRVWVQYSSLELYSYLLVTPIVTGLIYASVLKKPLLDLSPVKLLLHSLLYVMGGLALFSSTLFEDYGDQLTILGTILITNSAIALYIPSSYALKAVLVLLTPLIMIPLPQWAVYQLSAILTRQVLSIAVPVTRMLGVSISLTEAGGYIVVSVKTGNSLAQFDIAPVCSGVIGLFSVLAVSPLIIYASLNGSAKIGRRILGGVVGVASLAILMFLANTLRLIMVFYFTSVYGFDVGYNLFHYTPELVLVIPIVLVSLKIVDKIACSITLNPLKNRGKISEGGMGSNAKYLAILPIIVLSPVILPLLNTSIQTPHRVFVNTVEGPVMVFDVSKGVKYPFIPERVGGVVITYIGRDVEVEKSLSPTHRIHVYRGVLSRVAFLDIYVEFSEQASIHIWELCLWWQNMSVYTSRIFSVEDPSSNMVFSGREVFYGNQFMKGYLISWRGRYYTEKGVEHARFTVMVNVLASNVTEHEVDFVRSLARNLVIESLEASLAKYSRISGFNFNYYLIVVLPFTVVYCSLLYTYVGVGKRIEVWLRRKRS